MESHLVPAAYHHQEGTSSKPILQQQENIIMSRGAWGMGSAASAPRPLWGTAGRSSSVGAAAAAGGFNNNSDESSASWEVRAFAEDAASCSGQWPPRSYTCSFCQREFRTAQALGGHMNVHRRERAEANELALQQQQQQQQQAVAPPLPPPPSLTLPSAAAGQWCLYSPSPIRFPIHLMPATAAAPPCDEEVSPYILEAAAEEAGVSPSILHFPNCKSTVMNKLYMGGAFQPYQSRQCQEEAAVPPEEDHLDLELRLGPSMICGQ